MKYLLSIIISICLTSLMAQECNDAGHSINENDTWQSCTTSSTPNSARPNSHWLMYDLGHIYTLSTTTFWNYNKSGETEKGMKAVKIDVSLDGSSWTEAGEFELAQASGTSTYKGVFGPDLENTDARYILISTTETWGNSCAGLSEIRFDIGKVTTDVYDLYADDLGIRLYPNPTSGQFVIKGELDNFNIKILNINGTEVQNYNGISSLVTIDICELPDGLYFISVFHKTNELLNIQKILKQSE